MHKPTDKISISQKRKQQVLQAVDQLAANNQLAFITTQRISKASGISDGVLFRHFSSKEVILSTWVEWRAQQLTSMLTGLPKGRAGLRQLLQQLFKQHQVLNFLCCQPMDVAYLRQQLEASRSECWYVIQRCIEQLTWVPEGVTSVALTDHLMQSIYRAWNPENPEQEQHKEQLMRQLPWEKESPEHEQMPSQDVIQRLALNDSGFVFDPLNGRSFTANTVGLYILRFLQREYDMTALLDAAERDFDIRRTQAERDIAEFFEQLRTHLA